jgi:DNA processing protein
MALGIDGAAHQGALDAGGPTVAVLGSGLKVVYPRAHRGLFQAISEHGLLVTEFLPTDPALPHHFPRRNRIIAALARVIVVVEAGVRSGAFITVDHALDLGRDVMAFPGAVENPQARGTNRLLRDGARLLTHPEAILEELPWLGREGMEGESLPRDSESPVPEELRPLWAALNEEPMEVERLARNAGLAAGTVAAGLTALELMGRVRRCPGMRFRRV